jgi:N-acetylglucosamine kinase-like BadF-type ATPase
MSFFLGIDGGGTRTRAFVCDESGAMAAAGESGTTNPHHAGAEEISRRLAEAVALACARLHIRPAAIASAFLGVAGVTDEAGREHLRQLAGRSGLAHARLGVDHDIRIALAGGLEGRPGIALVVGTGSSCYGRRADGQTWQTGGWEALVSDEGSGYFLGREALTAAVRMADGRAGETRLRGRVFTWLGINDVAEILRRLGQPPMTKPEVAQLARLVVELAETGDDAARGILERGAVLLAELVATNHRRLPTGPNPEVVVTGGLGTAEGVYRRLIYAAIQRELPEARVGPPALAPAVGAALLALEQAGVTRSPLVFAGLKTHAL